MKLDEIKDPELRERIVEQMRQDEKTKANLSPSVAGLHDPKPQHREIQTLASSAQEQAKGSRGTRRIIVSISSHRQRILDADNFIGGCKGLRDAVARSLEIDDSERFITWEYHQIQTKGAQGTLVTICVK